MAQKPSPKKPVSGSKKRRRRVKLSIRSRTIKEKSSYKERVGWSTIETSGRVLEDQEKNVPTIWKHQCSQCGSVMQIPKPKRERYKVICPHCEFTEELSAEV